MTIPEALALVSDIGAEETPADKFLPVELKIAAILLALWTNKVESSNLIAGLYASANDNRPGDVSNFLTTTAAGEMSSTVDDDKDKEALLALLTETAVTGADIVSSKTSVTDSANAARIIALLTSQIRWFSNSYFARIVTPAIQAAMQKNVSALAPLNLKEAIQSIVNRTILNTPSYWRLTSNATTSRAHHYGLLVGSRDRNIYMQRWKSILDERTTALCFHGSTRVAPIGRLLRVFRRQYKGRNVTIRTASGKQFTSTPNHPILTATGWRIAQEVCPGDKIVNAFGGGGISVEQSVEMHPTFAALANAVFHPSISTIEHTSSSPADFHGDGGVWNEEVDTATIHCELRNDFNPFSLESLEHKALHWLHLSGSLSSDRGLGKLRFTGPPSVESSKIAFPSFENLKQASFTDPESSNKFCWPETTVEKQNDFIGTVVNSSSRAINHDAKALKKIGDSSYGNSEVPTDLTSGDSCTPFFDNIISVTVETGVFHVYNMETTQGVYSAEGILVKNCRFLNGKLFYTNRGIAELEKGASQHPAGILAGAWPTLEEVEALTPDELARSGLSPAVHYACRSTLVPVKT